MRRLASWLMYRACFLMFGVMGMLLAVEKRIATLNHATWKLAVRVREGE